MNVLVVGLGYVGLPLAVHAAQHGHQVTGYDTSIGKVLQLQSGSSPVEDVSDDLLKKAMGNELDGHLWVTSRRDTVMTFDVAVICVPTPLKDGRPDLSYVREAALLVGLNTRKGATVILESTTHPGTTRNVVMPLLEQSSGITAGDHFHLGFSPERIDPGNRWYNFANTTKLVSGLTRACLDKVDEFYTAMLVPTHRMDSLENAEAAKILENTFRHVNIALVNELSRVFPLLGVDIWDTIAGASTKPYGFMPFYPGPGVGGHCLPVDPAYLTEHVRSELGQSLAMVELALDVNHEQPDYIVRRVQDGLNERECALKNAEVLVMGLAYKPNTSDVRESPAFAIVEGLGDKGAIVSVVDPVAPTDRAEAQGAIAVYLDEVDFSNYDAVVLVTNHAAFDLQAVADKAGYVLDTRGVMPLADNIERL